MTRSQREAIETGGLNDFCLAVHPGHVCLHCGTCRTCCSGCGCDTPYDADGCECGGCEEDDESESEVTASEDRIEAGQARWAQTGSSQR